MEKTKQIHLIVILVIITLSLSAIILASGFAIRSKVENPKVWVLHSYGNNVALYSDGEIIEVYGSIAINTLPEADKRLLQNGIAFHSREEAQNAIEDYDG